MKDLIIMLIPYILLIIIAILIYIIFSLKKKINDLKMELILARLVLKLREMKEQRLQESKTVDLNKKEEKMTVREAIEKNFKIDVVDDGKYLVGKLNEDFKNYLDSEIYKIEIRGGRRGFPSLYIAHILNNQRKAKEQRLQKSKNVDLNKKEAQKLAENLKSTKK